ncbi:alpha/beta hydrolase [Oscillospiraceae bacterium LTW-04]|nr:alpha/beta hydrolase-fold protein [Oscillospiraceae bacterium MB24-C1]
MQIEKINTVIGPLERDVTVRVMLPDGYETTQQRYPVLYMNDGQYVFDKEDFPEKDSLEYARYYRRYSFSLPQVIIVAIACPNNSAERTAQYSPFTKDFDVPAGKTFESRIEGEGISYLAWLTGTLKPMIDRSYRTLSDAAHTAICGSSTGALNSLYALLKYPEFFSRAIAMSPAACIWMDHLETVLDEADYSHIKYFYLDVGTEEQGRMTEKQEFLDGAANIHNAFLSHGVPEDHIQYNIYPGGVHRLSEWKRRFPDALRWVFQDCVDR